MNLRLKLPGCYKLHLALVYFFGAALCLTESKLLDVCLRRLVQAIEEQVNQVRALLLGQLQHSLLEGFGIHGSMLAPTAL